MGSGYYAECILEEDREDFIMRAEAAAALLRNNGDANSADAIENAAGAALQARDMVEGLILRVNWEHYEIPEEEEIEVESED